MKLTIGIKAYNEEKHIAESVASAVEAARPFGGEVILADSGSADRTVEIAGQYPIRIVQLTRPQDRCCGAGAQLAFQHAAGEYFYLLDGDMVLKPGFMAAAVAFLDANPEFAGVGGIVNEVNTDALEFQIRAKAAKKDRNLRPGTVERLDCGGLYRTAAVREVGYYADRNLRAFEEFDLAARLQSRGWKLARIDRLAVDHYGHVMEGYALMWRRIKSGYSSACGQVVRGSMGNAHFPFVLRKLRQIWGGHRHGRLVAGSFWHLVPARAAAGAGRAVSRASAGAACNPYFPPPFGAVGPVFLRQLEHRAVGAVQRFLEGTHAAADAAGGGDIARPNHR